MSRKKDSRQLLLAFAAQQKKRAESTGPKSTVCVLCNQSNGYGKVFVECVCGIRGVVHIDCLSKHTHGGADGQE